MNNDIIVSKLLPFINNFIDDAVPNIRFNIAKSYLVIAETLVSSKESGTQKLINNEILPNLQKLQGDDDVDVRFFASKSIQGIKDLLN
ncbi:unnamed protein product [Debaryomyces fabryi]|nr:unnamed protein product [Debaryomyces fabryi]